MNLIDPVYFFLTLLLRLSSTQPNPSWFGSGDKFQFLDSGTRTNDVSYFLKIILLSLPNTQHLFFNEKKILFI